ncbi:MAG: serine/threonine-protein kinase, partial [Ignavibacteriaceae bacterium]
MIEKTILHYKILEKLGEGGMGVVYKAEDTKLHRQVALKFLPSSLTSDPDAKERFIQEARAASALDHPNVCTIHEINETEDGQMFIAMACYEGMTLSDKIANGQIPIDEIIDIVIQITSGLVKAHQQNIIHRDIKPANIVVTEDGL